MPAAPTNRGRGYNKDQFGVIDIDTTRYRYKDEPYILAAQAELVFYVNLVNKPSWSSVIVLKPRDLFAMPELELEDSIDVGIEGINLLGGQHDFDKLDKIGQGRHNRGCLSYYSGAGPSS